MTKARNHSSEQGVTFAQEAAANYEENVPEIREDKRIGKDVEKSAPNNIKGTPCRQVEGRR